MKGVAIKKPSLPSRSRAILIALATGTLVAFLLHLGIGSYSWFSPLDVLAELFRGPTPGEGRNDVIWQFRLPRAVACVLVGGILGVVGSAFQALFRNPLAEPFTVGVSSGAAVGGAVALVFGFGTAYAGLAMFGCGFLTAMLTLGLVYSLARKGAIIDVRTLLLAGVAIGALFSALLSLILLLAGKDTNAVLSWLLGDTRNMEWPKSVFLAIALAAGGFALVRESRQLNALSLGHEVAERLGIDAQRLTRAVLLTGSAMTAAAVGAVGIIGFLGLVAPHIARGLLGVDWRLSLPGSLLVGSLLLLLSDVIAQRVFSAATGTPGMDIPVGIVTAILGAPSLLILMRKAG